jgi:hypothetical protein
MRVYFLVVGFATATAEWNRFQATLAPCNASDAGQSWELRAKWGDNNTVFESKSLQCWDIKSSKRSPGGKLSAYPCCCIGKSYCAKCTNTHEASDAFNQRFLFANGVITDDVKLMGGLCVTAAKVQGGALITMEKCVKQKNGFLLAGQQWEYSSIAPHFRLSQDTTLCLDADMARPKPPSPGPGPAPASTVVPCYQNSTLSSLPFCTPSLPANTRAKDLVSRMTNDEKFTQVTNNAAAIARLGVQQYEYHSEGLHGLRSVCNDIKGLNATGFPQVTAMAATGNLSLIRAMGHVMSDEARAVNNIANGTIFKKGGGLDYWGPTMNIGR